jgi:hypothetical protein
MTKSMKVIGAFIVTMTISWSAQGQETSVTGLKGQTLRAYPKLMLLKKLGVLNIYWSNDVDCGREPDNCDRVVDQDVAFKIQKKIETDVLTKVNDFDAVAGQILSNWSRVRPALFPLSIKIELGQEIMNAGSNFDRSTVEIFSPDGSSLGDVKAGSSISLGIQNAGNLESVDTLVMHEFGHMVLRALGFPQMLDSNRGRVDSLIEETLPDFISSSTNADTPYMAPGLQDIVLKFAKDGLKDPRNDNFQRAMMEGHLQGISDKAMRDFTLNYSYSDLYLLPGHYVSSLHFNGLFYRLKQVILPEHLRNTVLRAIAERPAILLDGDAYQVVAGIIAFYAQIYPDQYAKNADQIRATLVQSGWVSATRTSPSLAFEVFSDTTSAVNVRIKPDLALMSTLLPATMRCLTYTVRTSGKTRFAFTQFLDWSQQQRLKLVPTASCDPSSPLCICGADKENLTIDGIYLSQGKQVSITQSFPVKTELTRNSTCYVLSFEWE